MIVHDYHIATNVDTMYYGPLDFQATVNMVHAWHLASQDAHAPTCRYLFQLVWTRAKEFQVVESGFSYRIVLDILIELCAHLAFRIVSCLDFGKPLLSVIQRLEICDSHREGVDHPLQWAVCMSSANMLVTWDCIGNQTRACTSFSMLTLPRTIICCHGLDSRNETSGPPC